MPSSRKLSADADKHTLYEAAVQAPDFEAAFLDRLFKRVTGRRAGLLREDFCGSAALACAWVALGGARTALGIDLDAPTLAWAEENNLAALNARQRERIRLRRANVLSVRRPEADMIAALNFSYSVLQTREDLLRYARVARASLAPGGLFVLDAWGGSETLKEHTDRKRLRGGWTYLWEQADFDPVSHRTLCHIHFEHKDGRRIDRAFTYDWRLWTLPELRETLAAAGFLDIHVLWEGTDRETNEGNGVYRRVERAPADPSWVSYLVGRAPGGRD